MLALVATLADRLQWIIENRGFKGAADLSTKAGLARGTVGHMIRGTTKGGQSGTLQKIAQAGDVSPDWLVSGRGEPGRFARVAIDDRYPNRRLVADLYRYEEPEAVKEFEGVALEAPDDPTIVWWTKRLLNIIERRQFEASNPAEAAARKATARGDAQAAADEIEAQRLAAREKRTAK
jgi:transcriptional regulator with XRE-family HTH domain